MFWISFQQLNNCVLFLDATFSPEANIYNTDTHKLLFNKIPQYRYGLV